MKIRRNYTIISLILGILAIFSFYVIKASSLQLVLGLFYLIYISYIFGELLFSRQRGLERVILGILVSVFVIIIGGTIFFYFYALNNVFFVVLTLGLPILLTICDYYCKEKQPIVEEKELSSNPESIRDNSFSSCHALNRVMIFAILVIVYSILTAVLFHILVTNSTNQAIRSPWNIIPSYFFIIFFIDTLALIGILLIKNITSKINYKLIFTSIYLFLVFGVVYFIYQLGYGFDPFIHEATLKVIWETGTISPKPFYYIGQYSLIIYFAKLLGLSIDFLNKILVPALAVMSLPTVIYVYLRQIKYKWLVLISVFLIPFSFLIFTTPQNLANLLLIILIILSLVKIDTLSPILVLNSLAILFIHPLTGIPAIFFVVIYLLWQYYLKTDKKQYRKLFIILSSLGVMSLPIIWLINSKISPQAAVAINTDIIQIFNNYIQNLKLLYYADQGQFKVILNILYFFYFNLSLILGVVFIGSLWRVYKNNKLKQYVPYLVSFVVFFMNYLILKFFFNFSFLINYERGDYTERVLQISYFFLIPLLLFFLIEFYQQIRLQRFWYKFVLIIILAIGLTGSFYLIYPRNDDFVLNRGFNLSGYDIEAVKFIEKNATDEFIVLANQQVSVGAIKEFGFKKYYQTDKGQIFYYPIPTSSPLYQYYLKMVNKKPTREIMEQAMDLVGVKEGYLVVNKYWWNSSQIIDWAKLVADDSFVIGDGEVYVFKFVD